MCLFFGLVGCCVGVMLYGVVVVVGGDGGG